MLYIVYGLCFVVNDYVIDGSIGVELDADFVDDVWILRDLLGVS